MNVRSSNQTENMWRCTWGMGGMSMLSMSILRWEMFCYIITILLHRRCTLGYGDVPKGTMLEENKDMSMSMLRMLKEHFVSVR